MYNVPLFASIFKASQLTQVWVKAQGGWVQTGRFEKTDVPKTSARAVQELQDVCHPPLNPHRPPSEGLHPCVYS